MVGAALGVWLVAAAAASGATQVAPVSGGNALTLPAHRHLVRIETGGGRPATSLLAVQHGGAGPGGLHLYRSDDASGVGRTWRRLAAVQPDAGHLDRAELVAVGRDVALLYSYEAPSLAGSTRHDVYFQWWRYREDAHTWEPEAAVRVFDSTSSSTAYSRAELARDSRGRLWVQAFRLESDGGSTAVLAVSEDGGRSFRGLPSLGRTKRRGGGRLLHLGSQLVFVWAMHDGFEPTRLRVHRDADAPEAWSAQRDAFSDGIYHGAALSAVADGAGGMHLVYKDETERLYYRHYDGTSFGPRLLVESRSSWALQPATTRVGDALYIFFNARRSDGTYELGLRVLQDGQLGSLRVVDGSRTFKGYPNAFATLPTSVGEVPILWGDAPDANSSAYVVRAAVSRTPTGDDGGTEEPPPPPPPPPAEPGALLFSDDFERRVASGLGEDWAVTGRWFADGRAVTDLDGTDVALATQGRCLDCEVEAYLRGFGVDEVGVALRASSTARYTAVLRADGRVEVRRYAGTAFRVLGAGASGLADPRAGFTLALSARGAGPVELTVRVNGTVRLSVTDASPDALVTAGAPGLVTRFAGVVFDRVRVRALEGGAPPPPPPEDEEPPPPPPPPDDEAPAPGAVLVSDDFERAVTRGLGAGWTVSGEWYTSKGRAVTGRNVPSLALADASTCADCEVEARLRGYGAGELGVVARAQDGGRYVLVLRSDGVLELRRDGPAGSVVLQRAPSGVAELGGVAEVTLAVRGAGPVVLEGWVDGVMRLTFSDAGAGALTGAGRCGLFSPWAGVWWDAFEVRAAGSP